MMGCFSPLALSLASANLVLVAHASVALAGAEGVLDGHLQRLGGLLRDHLPVHERVLDARVVLDQPVLAQLEVEVLQLVHGEGVVVTPVEVADLGLLLRDLGGRPRAGVGVGRLQAELRAVHVVLLAALHGRGLEGAGPPEEHAEHDVPRVVDVEDVLTRDEVLRPEVGREGRPTVVGDLEGSVEASVVEGDELLGLDVPLEGRDGRTQCARRRDGRTQGAAKEEGHGSNPGVPGERQAPKAEPEP
mmetsp:Transcript_117336/g.252296  ORF Transcript_117336/g.252296 Transcript_117336/m.252296 type:complete len:246 (-) Transcript_117336:24-761(-)